LKLSEQVERDVDLIKRFSVHTATSATTTEVKVIKAKPSGIVHESNKRYFKVIFLSLCLIPPALTLLLHIFGASFAHFIGFMVRRAW